MHMWGDKDVDWDGINEAVDYLAAMRVLYRMPVWDAKEKFGTVRLTTGLGWHYVYDIMKPGWHFIHSRNALHKWILWLHLPRWLRYLSRGAHSKLYRYRYKQALKKWPHLREEILVMADHEELLEGL